MLGKRVITLGEMRDPTKAQRWAVPDGSIFTDDPTEVFRARVAPFSLDSIVNRVAWLTRDRLRNEDSFRQRLRGSGASEATFSPFLLRRLVTGAIADRELPDQQSKAIGIVDLHHAELVLMDVVAVADERLRDGSEDSAWSLMMRALQHQYHDQLSYSMYKRELWLSRRIVERALELGVDIERHYMASLGLSYTDLSVLSFAAYATIIGDESTGVLDPQNWIGEESPLEVGADLVSTFFELTGLNYQGVQGWADHKAVVKPGYEPYALSPINNWPLLQRDDGLYVAPINRDILERPTRGFPIDLQKVVPKGDLATVQQATGEVYETYVSTLLGCARSTATIHRGSDVLPTDRPNCDYVAVEGSAVTLVETKSVRFSLEADMTKDFDVLRAELEKRGVAHGLAQISESARAIRQQETEFPRNSILTGLLVVRGEQVWLNSPKLRALLEDMVYEETGNRVFVKYQLINDEGLEVLTRHLSAGHELGAFLQEKCAIDGVREEDFEDTVGRVISNDAPKSLMAEDFDIDRASMMREYGFQLDDSEQ